MSAMRQLFPIPDIFHRRDCHLVATVISNIDVGGANDRTYVSTELMQMINNCYQVSQALQVAATLGVADQLKDGPKPYEIVADGGHQAVRPQCRG